MGPACSFFGGGSTVGLSELECLQKFMKSVLDKTDVPDFTLILNYGDLPLVRQAKNCP